MSKKLLIKHFHPTQRFTAFEQMNKVKKIPFVLLKVAWLARKVAQLLSSLTKKEEKKETKNKVDQSPSNQANNATPALVVFDNMVYQLNSNKSEIIAKEAQVPNDFFASNPKLDTQEKMTSEEETKKKNKEEEEKKKKDEEEKKKKEFDSNMAALNYSALVSLFLIEFLCNTVIWSIIGS